MPDGKQELVIERVFGVPRDRVWWAWTEAYEFAKWYGAPGKVDPDTVSIDAQEGGRWNATTVDPGGGGYPFTGSFREVTPPERLVLTFDFGEGGDNTDDKVEVVTVELTEEDGKTKMWFRQAGNLPPQEYDVDLRKGWGGFFDKLEEVLKEA